MVLNTKCIPHIDFKLLLFFQGCDFFDTEEFSFSLLALRADASIN